MERKKHMLCEKVGIVDIVEIRHNVYLCDLRDIVWEI